VGRHPPDVGEAPPDEGGSTPISVPSRRGGRHPPISVRMISRPLPMGGPQAGHVTAAQVDGGSADYPLGVLLDDGCQRWAAAESVPSPL
jgi:hypothetical protein